MDWKFIPLPFLAISLAACSERTETSAPHHGRYAGIGVYSAGPLWQPQRGLVSVIIPRTTGSALAPRIGHLSDYAMFMPKIDRTRMMAV